MSASNLPVDLEGATVVRISWPPRGFQVELDGKTSDGLSVAGARLKFEDVVNQFPLRMFLSEKRFIQKRVVHRKNGPPITFTDNSCESYPLKLPAKVSHLRLSRARRVNYGDHAFTDCHGPPPGIKPGQQLLDFGLAEKRFKNRKPFPIICARIILVDRKGQPLIGEETPPQKSWPTSDHEQIGRRFAEAILQDKLSTAWTLCSKQLRKQKSATALREWTGDWRGAALPLPRGLKLSEHLHVEVTDDANEVWDRVATDEAGTAPQSVLAIVTISFAGRREERTICIVEEAGKLQVGRLF